jgi:hypothetical protein
MWVKNAVASRMAAPCAHRYTRRVAIWFRDPTVLTPPKHAPRACLTMRKGDRTRSKVMHEYYFICTTLWITSSQYRFPPSPGSSENVEAAWCIRLDLHMLSHHTTSHQLVIV